jgi:hypothetical protein
MEFTTEELAALAVGDFDKVPGAIICSAADRIQIRLLATIVLELKRNG